MPHILILGQAPRLKIQLRDAFVCSALLALLFNFDQLMQQERPSKSRRACRLFFF
jgi:hypothetical protein